MKIKRGEYNRCVVNSGKGIRGSTGGPFNVTAQHYDLKLVERNKYSPWGRGANVSGLEVCSAIPRD